MRPIGFEDTPQSGRYPRPARQAPAASGMENLYRLRLNALWTYFKAESAPFWLVTLYLFFEYVRPQQIYPAFAGFGIVRYTIIACTVAHFLNHDSRKWNVADTGLVVYSVILLSSCLTAYDPSKSFAKLEVYFTWMLVYVLISTIVNSERRFFFFMFTYVLWCLKMSLHGARTWASAGFGFVDWGTTCAPGFFHNSGECGIQMAMFFPVALFFFLALRSYWGKWTRYAIVSAPITAVMTIVASSSRGAIVALAGVGLWLLSKSRRYFVRSLIGIALGAVLVYAIMPPEQIARFRNAGDDKTSQSRLIFWRHGMEMLHQFPLTGIGYENWMTYYVHEVHDGSDPQLPHNIFIQAGAELGYPGLLTFIALILITFAINRKTRVLVRPLGERGKFLYMMANGLDCALVGFAISGYFVTVLYYPFFWINLAMTVALYNTALGVRRIATPRPAARATPAAVGMRPGVIIPPRGL